MIRKITYFSLIISALAAAGCTGTTATNTNSNANTATVAVSNAADPTQNISVTPPATNSAVPGIPNAPANLAIKDDPTRAANPKAQMVTRPAPDNSEIAVSLADFPIETRTFKNHPQLAKVERIQDVANKKTIVKVYLKTGQMRELPEGKIQDPMSAAAKDIVQAVSGAAPAKPDAKQPAPKASDTKSAEQAPPASDSKPQKQP